MYCIECGSPIEASTRTCPACRFPQPLEEFADVEPGLTPTGPRTVLPVRFLDTPPKPASKARLAPAIAVFIALCISTGLSVYLLTRQVPEPTTKPAEAPPAETEAKSN
jgi:hypothetical protein